MRGAVATSAFARVSRLASLPPVHAAFRWFHLQEKRVMEWQRELVAIAAPPFGERLRAEWLAERFRELQLQEAGIDAEGNVVGALRSGQSDSPCILLSAHIDTVFPGDTLIQPVLEGHHLTAPGSCDNGAGVAALLAVAAALAGCGGSLPADVVFVGNVGEEGDGNLRGVRYLYEGSPWRERISAHVVLDGAGTAMAVTRALGSRRYLVTLRGPGGHSWTDAGTPNPIVAMSHAISALSEVDLPEAPRTTLNVGTIEGGSSVNSIPEWAAARFDLRSLEAGEITRLEVALRHSVQDATQAANERPGLGERRRGARNSLEFEIQEIGNRPAGELAPNAPLLEALRAVDRHLGIHTDERAASTDANLPLSLGIPALTMGAGGRGGGVHTRNEWYDSRGRELALKRILLLLLSGLALPGDLTSEPNTVDRPRVAEDGNRGNDLY